MTQSDIDSAFVRVCDAAEAAGLPGVETSTSYGTPVLRVGRKSMIRMKDAETLVLMCELEDKEMLMQAAPEIYYETDHTKAGQRCSSALPRSPMRSWRTA